MPDVSIPEHVEPINWKKTMLFDFDSGTPLANLEAPLCDVHALIDYLRDLPEKGDIRVYFSGNRGFHVLVDSELPVDTKEPHKARKELALFLANELGLSTLDVTVYTPLRLLLKPGATHPKTGIPKALVNPYDIYLKLWLKEYVALYTPTETEVNAQPPKDWDSFLQLSVQTHIEKNTDYDSRFMRALIDNQGTAGGSHAIWAWEVDKKLDRIRTWIKRGELLVKDEGLLNSVVDLFNYTVQYSIWWACNEGLNAIRNDRNPLDFLNADAFLHTAKYREPEGWIAYLTGDGRIKTSETQLIAVILLYMGQWHAAGSRIGLPMPFQQADVLQRLHSQRG